jgi:hypothetical protein
MRIKILSSAVEDLYAGRLFYEKQGEGLGEYFFNSLFSDIDSLSFTQVSIKRSSVTTVFYPSDSLMPCTTHLIRT